MGKIFLVIINSYSKWLEVTPVPSVDTFQTVIVLQQVFSSHGIPETILSDNGAAFTSLEFEMFTRQNGIRHLTTIPYHPLTNGLAERISFALLDYTSCHNRDDSSRTSYGASSESTLRPHETKYQ